jgi:transketolase
VPAQTASRLAALKNVATRLRIESLRSTSEAGSGHPSTCCSAAEVMAALFFADMRYDPGDPHNQDNDRFVLSKGHAAPILYAAWAEAGIIPRGELLTLRQIGSDLEGHPTPRLPWVDVATGSLGQGICAAVGIALNATRIGSSYRTYALLGDGETAEGSVWEAADVAGYFGLDSLCAITDVNALGQSQPTQWQHDMEGLAARWRAFKWNALVVDGHDMQAVLDALAAARQTRGRPTMILARTLKGKGVSLFEGKEGWHGKALKKGPELDAALAELQSQIVPDEEPLPAIVRPASKPRTPAADAPSPRPPYALGDEVATREAFGDALARLGVADPRIVVLDADVKNSTFTEKFQKACPDRFYECFIAEQIMVGAAMGFAARGAIPFPATFGAFFSRAADFIRMAAISNLNIRLVGSHVGVSIGEDGPSQMALEDLAIMRAEPNMTVLYPCDAVSTERLVREAAYRHGPVYVRTSRPKAAVIYGADELFPIGGLKVLRSNAADVATVIAAGVTVHEALSAYEQLQQEGVRIRVVDLYSVQPVDAASLVRCAREAAGRLITVEDHYAAGGIGDAVAAAVAGAGFTVHRVAVREIPRSGRPEELLDRYGISARHIVDAVRHLMTGGNALPPTGEPEGVAPPR